MLNRHHEKHFETTPVGGRNDEVSGGGSHLHNTTPNFIPNHITKQSHFCQFAPVLVQSSFSQSLYQHPVKATRTDENWKRESACHMQSRSLVALLGLLGFFVPSNKIPKIFFQSQQKYTACHVAAAVVVVVDCDDAVGTSCSQKELFFLVSWTSLLR